MFDTTENPCIPLYIDLSELEVSKSLLRQWSDECGLEYFKFRDIAENYRILVILDAYDGTTDQSNLYQLNKWKEFGSLKLITFIRPESVQLSERARKFEASRDCIGVPSLPLEYEIQPFNSSQVNEYIMSFLEVWRALLNGEHPSLQNTLWAILENIVIWPSSVGWQKYQSYLKNFDLHSLIETPFLLYLTLLSLPKLVVAAGTSIQKVALSRLGVYEKFTSEWFDFQAKKLQKHSFPNLTIQEIAGLLRSYHENLAWLFLKSEGDLETKSLSSEDSLKSWLWEPASNQTFLLDKNEDLALCFQCPSNLEALRNSALVSVVDGKVSFLHRSLLEFFAARRVQHVLTFEYDLSLQGRIGKDSMRSVIKNPDVLHNLSEKVKEDPSFGSLLSKIILSSKTVQPIRTIAANSITILNFAGISFSGQDFSDIQVPGADLSSSICFNTNFKRADLSGVSFRKSLIMGAKFNGAYLPEVDFGVGPTQRIKGTVCQQMAYQDCSSGINFWFLGLESGIVFQMEMETLEIVAKFRHREKGISPDSIKFLIYDKFLVTWFTRGSKIRKWDLVSGKKLESLKVDKRIGESGLIQKIRKPFDQSRYQSRGSGKEQIYEEMEIAVNREKIVIFFRNFERGGGMTVYRWTAPPSWIGFPTVNIDFRSPDSEFRALAVTKGLIFGTEKDTS
jgi:hypothetical protein